MSGKLSARTKITMLLSLLLIPLTIWAGLKFGGGRKFMLISFAIIFETMLPFFLIFRGKKTPGQRTGDPVSAECAGYRRQSGIFRNAWF